MQKYDFSPNGKRLSEKTSENKDFCTLSSVFSVFISTFVAKRLSRQWKCELY